MSSALAAHLCERLRAHRGEEIRPVLFFSRSFCLEIRFFFKVILGPKLENRSLSREVAIFRERSEPQASRSDALARRARAKRGKAISRREAAF